MIRNTLPPFHTLLGAILLASICTAVAADTGAPASTNRLDPWQALRPLLGKWQGSVKGEPGTGKAEREYAFTLNNRFIHVTNKSIYSPQEKNPKGETHEDVAFISYDKSAKKLVMRQFHVEGFVNQYVLDRVSDDGRTLVFTTTAIENIAAGWRARETYHILGNDEFVETFALAEPGKDFATYTETQFTRVRGGK